MGKDGGGWGRVDEGGGRAGVGVMVKGQCVCVRVF